MPHVDEGTLHAYLDGEVPSSERSAVEAHVASCTSCRATLVEERALRERASALLGAARPAERVPPPFEELHRAPRRSPWRVRTPFAWAASIALAVGLGYYLRAPASDELQPLAPRAIASRQDQAAPAARDDRAAATPARPQPRTRRPASQVDAVARQTEAASADSAARGESALSGVVAIAPQLGLRNATPVPAAAAPPRPRDSLVLSEAIVALVPRALVATEWPVISRGVAASMLGTKPVGLPGLATRRIRRSPGPDSTVVVEQALDASTVIQIFQRPADGVALYDSSGYGYIRGVERADRLARFVGRLRVEISGPLSPDSLNKLLEQVEPLP